MSYLRVILRLFGTATAVVKTQKHVCVLLRSNALRNATFGHAGGGGFYDTIRYDRRD